jgi:hypothetical protein
VIERACLLFPGSKVEAKHVRDHLLRLRAPDPVEEQDALWNASADFGQPALPMMTMTASPPCRIQAIIATGLPILTQLMSGGIFKMLRLF